MRIAVLVDGAMVAEALVAVLRAHGDLVVDIAGSEGLEDADVAIVSTGPRLSEVVTAGGHPRIVAIGPDEMTGLALAAGAGAIGYVSTRAAAHELIAAVRTAAAHRPGAVSERGPAARPSPGARAGASPAKLTRRQAEVLELLATGLSPQAIASRLGVSTATVRSHLRDAYLRLGVHSALEAVSMTLQSSGILTRTR
jgi:two-component system nitrate/nitrite response regulator NarL